MSHNHLSQTKLLTRAVVASVLESGKAIDERVDDVASVLAAKVISSHSLYRFVGPLTFSTRWLTYAKIPHCATGERSVSLPADALQQRAQREAGAHHDEEEERRE